MTLKANNISVSINRPATQVYDFASNPKNLPTWASGLSGSIKKVEDTWIAEAPMGRVVIKFADTNVFGVLDHNVILPSGVSVYNPMRVVPNGDGSEIIFTLFCQADTSEDKFQEDAEWVKKDLEKLKMLLERS